MIEADTEAFLWELKQSARLKLHDMPVAQARVLYRQTMQKLDVSAPPLLSVHDLTAPGPAAPIPVRLYYPEGLVETALIVYFHGGGWCIGDLDSHHSFCATLADELKARVLAVDYRLAPEHPFPAAHEDCRAVVQWAAGSPPELGASIPGVALAGDSAGATIAAATTLRLRNDPTARPRAQLLLYPVADLRLGHESHAAYGDGFGLDSAAMHWFRMHYAPDEAAWSDSRLSILLAPDLSHLPPTVILTCALDILRDEGHAFADRLIAAGNEVRFREVPGQIHGIATYRAALRSAIAPLKGCITDFGNLLSSRRG